MSPLAILAVLLVVALTYDFLNGFHDSPTIVATMIASRAMSAPGALALAAVATFCGPFVLGVAVAHTVGEELVVSRAVTIEVAVSALASASLWNLATWYYGIPVSSSHALMGGLIGSALAAAGTEAIRAEGLVKIGVALLAAPVAGFVAALAAMQATRAALRSATPKANVLLGRLQVATAALLALGHGANDAQKTVGIIALGLVLLGFTPTFVVPWWAIVLCASALALGTMLGGGRIVRTLGARFYRIRPIHGFTSQAASAGVILAASLAGGPVSTSQVVSMAIVGAGAAERRSMVRWMVLAEIAIAWVLTVPATALVALPAYYSVSVLLRGLRG